MGLDQAALTNVFVLVVKFISLLYDLTVQIIWVCLGNHMSKLVIKEKPYRIEYVKRQRKVIWLH